MDLDKVKFLIVDDNAHMRTLIKTILLGLGAERPFYEANEGGEALTMLRYVPADIVICDWMMSPVDGYDFTRLVRTASDSPNPYIPIIMITGHTEAHRVLSARDAGVTEFLAKPLTASNLYERIHHVILHPRPFVKTKRYFGPDRRRQQRDFKGADQRVNPWEPPADYYEKYNGERRHVPVAQNS